jgi:hypothetical protein
MCNCSLTSRWHVVNERDVETPRGLDFYRMKAATRQIVSMFAVLLALAGCAQPERAPESARPTLPEASYIEAARQGAAVYRIQTAGSRVLVRVGRAGRLKGLGHDHAVASEDIEGLIMISADPDASRADLLVPLKLLVVDRPEYRAQIGIEGDVSESAIEGTYSNMQDKVLESSVHPWAQVSARFANPQSNPPTLLVSITLHGAAFEYTVPVELQVDPDQLIIEGDMTMRHEDFGLAPFSAAGGLLRVAEDLQLQFSLVAKRVQENGV